MEKLCKTCSGVSKLVLGALLFGWVWWWPALVWQEFFGGVLVVMGLAKLLLPACPGCMACNSCEMPSGKKKR